VILRCRSLRGSPRRSGQAGQAKGKALQEKKTQEHSQEWLCHETQDAGPSRLPSKLRASRVNGKPALPGVIVRTRGAGVLRPYAERTAADGGPYEERTRGGEIRQHDWFLLDSCVMPFRLGIPFRFKTGKLDKSTGPIRRSLQYAFYDWTREMPRSKRFVTYAGIILQGYAFYFTLMWALMLPKWMYGYFLVLPRRPVSYVLVFLLFYIGHWIQNGMLTSEFVRKTQLETDQIAARQIQQTLQPGKLEELAGYELESFYKPLREVGGDYFDVIELSGGRTLFALADVSGKGIAAALLAANVQALVRSMASVEPSALALAKQINKHLSRYTPSDRFATAVFLVLSPESGELAYVNAGHNAPIVYSSGSTTFLEATGPPLGLFEEAEYETGTAILSRGSSLLVYTDGLTDSMQAEHPENRLRDAFAESAEGTMANLKELVDPKFNEDDVTILLVKRRGGTDQKRVE
jgi:hypothetical protein